MVSSGAQRRVVVRDVLQRPLGVTVQDVAVQHGVGRAICFRWLHRMMQGHAIDASSKWIYKTWSSISSDHMEIALMHLQQSPPSHAAFQRELCQLIEVETGVHYDQFQIHRALNKELALWSLRTSEPLRLFFRVFFAENCNFSAMCLCRRVSLQGYWISQTLWLWISWVASVCSCSLCCRQSASAICAMALNGMISVNVFEGEISGDIFIANLENEPLSLSPTAG